MEEITVKVDEVYVPAKRRRTLVDATVEKLAESILEEGLKLPILVRRDETRYILVEGYHRLEACRALGEETIEALVVSARIS